MSSILTLVPIHLSALYYYIFMRLVTKIEPKKLADAATTINQMLFKQLVMLQDFLCFRQTALKWLSFVTPVGCGKSLDAKKSPLALLAQTCSQIGADSPTKPLISPLDKAPKSMNNGTNAKSPPAAKLERSTRSSPSDGKSLAFKPYEANVVSKKPADESRPASKASVHSVSGQESVSVSESTTGHAEKKPSESNLGAYKPGLPGFSGNPLCCPPGLAENPAFRPPFAGASPFSHHHAAAAALLGYPSSTPTGGNPYLSYARVKTPAGGEALVPVCKDPYCTGCQYSMHSAQLMMSTGACPSGCTQCDHQKYGLAMALSSFGPMAPPSLSYPSTLTGGRPYVCNWIAGDSYCGKRFTTSEELLQHLRSHTSLTGGDHASSSAALLTNPHPHPLLSPSAALHRASGGSYPTPSLSPLSARYHPYGKPPTGPLPASLAASPYSAFNALGPYYSPYAIYGQRIGAAAINFHSEQREKHSIRRIVRPFGWHVK
ncbi:Zinc finger protein Noc [Melipona quadrifasciata]|uniref:Zinc finger protein Noc n=1 Tax=Melipona quadrifasciata TaxID=166423 RepID=A0A0M8ZZR6_9HYME|nr:Zinc finger protein Noc [Melipona quadrifasciata]